jgi:hypothetical protein
MPRRIGVQNADVSRHSPMCVMLARSVLRHIRVASKRELKDRPMAAMVQRPPWFNGNSIVHTRNYMLDKAA